MDEITPESIRNLLNQNGPQRSSGPSGKPDDLLSMLGRDPAKRLHTQNPLGGGNPAPKEPHRQQAPTTGGAGVGPPLQRVAELDSNIRNSFVELIRTMAANGQAEELQEMLLSHRSFIEEILTLLQQPPQR